jgi:hypothetical protein
LPFIIVTLHCINTITKSYPLRKRKGKTLIKL